MEIVTVHPDNLRGIWPQIKAGLDAMPPSDWIAEDVYHAIKSRDSALCAAYGDSGFLGFMVLRQMRQEFSCEPYLHIWLVYNVGGADVMAAGQEILRQTAAKMGAKKITFGSPRKGWSKRYPLTEARYEIPL